MNGSDREFIRINRRLFLRRLGKGTLAVAVLGSCGGTTVATALAATTTTSSNAGTIPSTTLASTTSVVSQATFQRVNLGFVSAYLIARGSEAAVVDTGVAGSVGSITAGLGEIGLDWPAVGHVILTHRHPDHAGSLGEVLEAAPDAVGFAGAEDLRAINSPRELSPLANGDEVFGLTVIATPGHTAGHISVLDEESSVLVVGDAMNGANGGVIGANPEFSDDMTIANETVRKLAGLSFETVYFGHGEPVETGASALVAELAAGL